jgi:hypothetical protein
MSVDQKTIFRTPVLLAPVKAKVFEWNLFIIYCQNYF